MKASPEVNNDVIALSLFLGALTNVYCPVCYFLCFHQLLWIDSHLQTRISQKYLPKVTITFQTSGIGITRRLIMNGFVFNTALQSWRKAIRAWDKRWVLLLTLVAGAPVNELTSNQLLPDQHISDPLKSAKIAKNKISSSFSKEIGNFTIFNQ